MDSNTINSNNGTYKIKMRKIITYILLEKIKELEYDKESSDSIINNINNDLIKFICGSETIKDDNKCTVEDNKIIYIYK